MEKEELSGLDAADVETGSNDFIDYQSEKAYGMRLFSFLYYHFWPVYQLES